MYVCICNAVTDRQIREAAAKGVECLDGLACETGAGTCCGACRPLAIQVLDQARAELDFAFAPAAA
ncbi:MAG TPA: (2Fe-2S)-binding protein [Xanthomonadales bacterium]|nr:(2Fe-2S)-binding protein [Xanthomonadales bacterium]